MPKKRKKSAGSTAARAKKSTGNSKSTKPSGSSAVAEPPSVKSQPKSKSKSKKKAGKKSSKRASSTKATKRVVKKAPKQPVFTAATADKHELYQLSVQSPEEDAKFLRRTYKSIRGKQATHLREDFCGTGLLASHWIKKGKQYTAEGFDIDPDPVGWGIEHNFAPLGENASRCTLHLKDVREPSLKKPDIRVALNFSYCLFKQRAEMVQYFATAFKDLDKEGLFILDIHGGPEAMEEMEEEREIEEGFDYIWDQDRYWPATGDYKCYIHFEFEDGTRLEKAFAYDWRLWGLPEVVDCLKDAGFTTVDTYWEGTDEDGESGDGNFRKKKKGENCLSWISYIVCQK